MKPAPSKPMVSNGPVVAANGAPLVWITRDPVEGPWHASEAGHPQAEPIVVTWRIWHRRAFARSRHFPHAKPFVVARVIGMTTTRLESRTGAIRTFGTLAGALHAIAVIRGVK